MLLDGLALGGEQALNEFVSAVLDQKGKRRVEGVVVLLDELGRCVDNAACEVLYEESLVVSYFAVGLQFGFAGNVYARML